MKTRVAEGHDRARRARRGLRADAVADHRLHMHARMAPSKEPLPCEPQPCAPVGSALTEPGSVLQGTLRAMDEYDIVKGFLSDDVDSVYKWVTTAPGRFIASPAWGTDSPPAIGFLRDEYRQGRLQAMGEIGSQYAGIAPNDPQIEPYFALAEELDLPVLIHTAGFGAPLPLFRPSRGHPLLLEDVVIWHPRMRTYVAAVRQFLASHDRGGRRTGITHPPSPRGDQKEEAR